MNALITGGAGLIGSHFVDHLLTETDQDIHIVDNFSTGRRSNIEHTLANERVEIDDVDVRETEEMHQAVSRADIVYHFAAALGVERIVDNPLSSLQTNIRGTENILDAAAKDGTPVFVASSSEVYGKSPDLPFSEEDDCVLGPTSVPRWGYATAKAIDEFYAFAHHAENDLPIVVGRFFNTVGPRQVGDYGMVIPTFVERALADEPIQVYGDGTQTRSFTHVRDAVKVVRDLMNTPNTDGDVFNIGSSESISINELAEQIILVTDSNSKIEHVPFAEVFEEDFEEPRHRKPDVSKLRETIGWAPETSLNQIIEDVVDAQQSGAEVPT
ncbi:MULTISPECIES: GDP-mannose 4,6-dehydratase [Salinibaculum]|uniref:GDP-mannose 4,6-dehydratase n=1 Tax=Salinibaculum TaxID=2732368 RepID=UPI0030D068C5